MKINHGVLNDIFYKTRDHDELLIQYPILNTYKEYFSNFKARDQYYIAMKYHAIKQIKLMVPEITLQYLGELVGGLNHSTIIYYMSNKYIPLPDHDKFIEENFDNYVKSYIYPISTRNYNYYIQKECGDYIGKYISPFRNTISKLA